MLYPECLHARFYMLFMSCALIHNNKVVPRWQPLCIPCVIVLGRICNILATRINSGNLKLFQIVCF